MVSSDGNCDMACIAVTGWVRPGLLDQKAVQSTGLAESLKPHEAQSETTACSQHANPIMEKCWLHRSPMPRELVSLPGGRMHPNNWRCHGNEAMAHAENRGPALFRQRALHCACHVAAPFPMLLGCSSEHTAGIFCGDSRGIASAHLLGVQCTAREIAAPAASRDGAPTSAGRTEHDTQALNDKTTVGAQLKHTTGKKTDHAGMCSGGSTKRFRR